MNGTLAGTGYLRINQIVGQTEVTEEQAARNRARGKGPKRARSYIAPIIPVSRATWYAGVRSGRFPGGIGLPGGQVSVWRKEDIYDYILTIDRQITR